MRILGAILVLVFVVGTATARKIGYWPYSKLVEKSDFVAVVEVGSITNAEDLFTGHGDTRRFQGRIASLKVGWVIKGEPTAETRFLFFTYSAAGQAEPDGAWFISFDEPDKHQYLVFLKREGDKLIPVTGHYDAQISVKVLKQDLSSRIENR